MNTASNTISVTKGMTDAELELACEAHSSGDTSWIHWASEIYSFGKCLRFWTRYPKSLPLFVYSDHGVGLHTHLFPHELKNQAKVHFTWHPLKEQRYKDFADKRVIQIIHPWISYRRMRGITRSMTPTGTLVFFAHSTPNTKFEGHDTEEYFERLRQLPNKFQPVVLCLHMHEIKSGCHKKLRRYGFPIVTAGNTLSTEFVDRFYDLVKDYSYATSQIFGSYFAYCVELGVPYFTLGKSPTFINISDKNIQAGAIKRGWDEDQEEYIKKAQALFAIPVDSVTEDQRAFVESLLGFDSRLNRWQVAWILWREFFRNWRQWHTIPRFVLVALIDKLGLLSRMKEYRQRFKAK